MSENLPLPARSSGRVGTSPHLEYFGYDGIESFRKQHNADCAVSGNDQYKEGRLENTLDASSHFSTLSVFPQANGEEHSCIEAKLLREPNFLQQDREARVITHSLQQRINIQQWTQELIRLVQFRKCLILLTECDPK